MSTQLTNQEQIFIEKYLKHSENIKNNSSIKYVAGYVILSLSGLFMLCYTTYLTMNYMVERVIHWVLIPGVISGVLLILTGFFLWKYYKKSVEKQKLLKIIKKLLKDKIENLNNYL